jgi:methionyl-tRNA formyltransferase
MITLILSETKRSLIYLDEIIKNRIKFQKIILYSKNKGIVYKFIKINKLINFLILLKTNNVNSNILKKKVKLNKSKINIISTYPGEIITNPLLFKYKLLHCHPGNLPMFKGSTTIYYTILLKKKLCVTLFEIAKKVDNGKILYKKYFNIPKNLMRIENDFDNKIRAATFIEYLQTKINIKYLQPKKIYLPYYIAHPLIRQIVLNKKYLKYKIK